VPSRFAQGTEAALRLIDTATASSIRSRTRQYSHAKNVSFTGGTDTSGGMEGAQQVMIHFGSEHELRYLTDIPAPGDFVSHRGELWIARAVSRDEGGVTVIARPAEGDAPEVSED